MIPDACEALQRAWDECDTLPPIIFTDRELEYLVEAVALSLSPTTPGMREEEG